MVMRVSSPEALLDHRLDPVRGDGVAVAILSAFGHDHDAVPVARLAARSQDLDHARLPVVDGGWTLGDQDPIRPRRDGAHQGQIAAVSPHHLDDKSALVTGGCAADGIDGFGDPVQRRIGSDGHIGAEHIVVN
jgi:hypothetical protein